MEALYLVQQQKYIIHTYIYIRMYILRSRCATYRSLGSLRSGSAITLLCTSSVPCTLYIPCTFFCLAPSATGLPQAARTVRRYLRRSKQSLRARLRGSSNLRHQHDAALGGWAARAAAGLLADDAAGDEGPARVAYPRGLDHFVMPWVTNRRFIICVTGRGTLAW